LLHDIKATLNNVVSPQAEYRHNDPQYSDCDRHNAHSHLQATLLNHALSFPVAAGKLVLGQFQAIIAAELDGPRDRDLAVQIIGH
ncbi:MAG TPA: YjbQ family protein, partial [Solirubrobacterales bacterium]|nr:YjbQ family protein [Solirubrobacterales bacterium]